MKQEDLFRNKESCCGCAACFNICPKHAIKMKTDEEGFSYPNVDPSCCVNCKHCVLVCPLKQEKQIIKEEQEFVIARSRDNNLLRKASSGGVISEAARHIINEGGAVCAAYLNDKFVVEHRIFYTLEEIQDISGSKYVQSDKGTIFQNCRELLNQRKTVLFIGTPCEVGAIQSFLGKDYDNLITIDFVCHGVPSKKYWTDYKKFLMDKYKSEIAILSFHDKSLGYRSTGMKVVFKNEKKYWASPRTDYMLKAFYSNIINRPSCSECAFKTKHHSSDRTCYDCWNAEAICDECKDDNMGYTNVLINSTKGKIFFEQMEEMLEWHSVGEEDIMPKGGGMLLKSAKKNSQYDEFWKTYNNMEFENVSKRYLNIKRSDYLIEKVKIGLNGLGMLRYISKIHVCLKRRKKS